MRVSELGITRLGEVGGLGITGGVSSELRLELEFHVFLGGYDSMCASSLFLPDRPGNFVSQHFSYCTMPTQFFWPV